MSPTHATARAFSWLDIKIPLWGIVTLIIGLMAQSASLLVWGTRMDEKINQNIVAITALQVQATSAAGLAVTVARIDERTKAMADEARDNRAAMGR